MSSPSQRARSGRDLAGPVLAVAAVATLFTGCASPGPPLPPSLFLPAPVKDLRAERVGDAVQLTWTTPSRTTDGLDLRLPLAAELCRDLLPTSAAEPPCSVVARLAAASGPSSARDPLPGDLQRDPARTLRYRVRLLNPAGRSAGLSAPAFAAAGEAPPPVRDLSWSNAGGGLRLLWSPSIAPAAEVVLSRAQAPPAAAPGPPPSSAAPQLLLGSPAGSDAGGSLDATGRRGSTYVYRAWRRRSVMVEGRSLTLRSEPSAPVTATLLDTAPPARPAGLQAIADGPAVDLSWEPSSAPDLAGYVVERQPGSSPDAPQTSSRASSQASLWTSLTVAPLAAPGFHDVLPSLGLYRYRVVAVDTAGNRSLPSLSVDIRSAP